MRAKPAILLVLALGCGLVAAVGITQVMANRNEGPQPAAGATESIFVAMTDVTLGETLTPQMVRLEPWPKDRIPEGALTNIEEVEGRRTRTRLFPGEPILEPKLFAAGTSAAAGSDLIPLGYRVVSVRVDATSGASGLILPGDRVDLLVHLDRNPNRNIPETGTRTVLQDIRVFAVDDVYNLDESRGDGRSSMLARNISLLVTPEQAERVTLASELGKVRLVLRSHADTDVTARTGTVTSDLLGGTEGASREHETLVQESSEHKTPQLAGFLSFLQETVASRPPEGVKEAPAHPAIEESLPAPQSSWVMRILKAGDVEDVVLEPVESAAWAGGGAEFWRHAPASLFPGPPSDGDQPVSRAGDEEPIRDKGAGEQKTAGAAGPALPDDPFGPSVTDPFGPSVVEPPVPQAQAGTTSDEEGEPRGDRPHPSDGTDAAGEPALW